MDFYDAFFYLSVFGGLLMAFSLGANDAANSMASAVGARAITVAQAILIAGSMNFVGAVFMGQHVVSTISTGIIDPGSVSNPKVLILAMFATLLTSGSWVLLSTLTGFPVSSTHAVVGGLMGIGVVMGGIDTMQWDTLGGIFLSWVLSPVLGGVVAMGIYALIRATLIRRAGDERAILRWCPVWMGLVAGVIVVFVIFETNAASTFGENDAFVILTVVFAMLFLWEMGKGLIKEYLATLQDHSLAVEGIFKRLQVFTSAYVSLAHGANDVANAFGPVIAIYLLAKNHDLPDQAPVPTFLLVLGGIGIAVGIAVLGKRVILTVGEKITKLNNTRGFSVDFSIATTVLACSHLGLPVSSTTVAVGAVTGVGLAQGRREVDFLVLGKIVLMWVVTVPVAAGTGALFFWIMKALIL